MLHNMPKFLELVGNFVCSMLLSEVCGLFIVAPPIVCVVILILLSQNEPNSTVNQTGL